MVAGTTRFETRIKRPDERDSIADALGNPKEW